MKSGDLITAVVSGEQYTIGKKLGEGTQGAVFSVAGPEDDLVVKWYNEVSATPPQKAAIKDLVRRGPPRGKAGKYFVWPIDLVESRSHPGIFGYLMREMDRDTFVELPEIQAKLKPQPNLPELCQISYKIADAFSSLHISGLCYRDMSMGNLTLDPKNGDILICDNDNVGVDNASTSNILGTAEFMAPEVIRGDANPSTKTDLHSLAVLIFNLWMWHHPMHGQAEYEIRSWDIQAKKRVYGDNPVFVFDPNNDSNRLPDAPGYRTAASRWKMCPPSLQNAFISSFTEGLSNPNSRVTEARWKSIFSSLQDNQRECSNCGAVVFWSEELDALICWNCHSSMQVPMRLIIDTGMGKTYLLMKIGLKIRRKHLDDLSGEDPEAVVGEVIRNPNRPDVVGLQNHMAHPWITHYDDGKTTQVPANRAMRVDTGYEIQFGNGVTATFVRG